MQDSFVSENNSEQLVLVSKMATNLHVPLGTEENSFSRTDYVKRLLLYPMRGNTLT